MQNQTLRLADSIWPGNRRLSQTLYDSLTILFYGRSVCRRIGLNTNQSDRILARISAPMKTKWKHCNSSQIAALACQRPFQIKTHAPTSKVDHLRAGLVEVVSEFGHLFPTTLVKENRWSSEFGALFTLFVILIKRNSFNIVGLFVGAPC